MDCQEAQPSVREITGRYDALQDLASKDTQDARGSRDASELGTRPGDLLGCETRQLVGGSRQACGSRTSSPPQRKTLLDPVAGVKLRSHRVQPGRPESLGRGNRW